MKIKYIIVVCRVKMWGTLRVPHILTRFSFFASFFLFKSQPILVNNYPAGISSLLDFHC
jgi:hypothetical protein